MRRLTIRFGLFLLLVSAALAPAVEFKRQTITVSSKPGWWLVSHLQDVDNDGLTDLLALNLLQRQLQLYRQRTSGFTDTPDQTLTVHRDAAWIGLHDIDPHPGNELLVSTATGIDYFRQNQGVFESSPRTLIEAQQVFTTDYPRLMANLSEWGDANSVVPITFADRTVVYERDSSGAWRTRRSIDLEAKRTTWRMDRSSDWAMGSRPSYNMTVRTWFRAGPKGNRLRQVQSRKDEIQKRIEQIEKDAQWRYPGVQDHDINGDGREDLVLWKSRRDLNPKTTVLVFIRDRDGRLAERPTHVLRDSGVPIRVNRTQGVLPMWDLDGDGKCELILLRLKTRVTSWSSLVNIALSGGVDWIFTVRSGRDGDYSRGPDFQMDITSRTPTDESVEWMFQIDGDFNGDGREDILLERSSDRYDVYLSDADTGFFRKEPPLSFKAPVEARTRIADYNGDGISDLLVDERRVSRVTVFLSQSEKPKGTQK